MARVLILPGWGDSGEGHWQTLWQQQRGYERVVQRDWLEPRRDDWVHALETALEAGPAPAILVAHSLACSLVAHVAQAKHTAADRVRGALLVAPADVEADLEEFEAVRSFAPIPMDRLPFPAIVVASRIDPFVRFARAEAMATAWGARFVDAGRAGHINVDSGHGPWPEGLALLDELVAQGS